jgi:hypothetical protein
MNTISLTTLAGGALDERFKDALQQVLDNIQDTNTEPKVKREILMKVTVTPDGAREIGNVAIDVSVKLVAPKTVGTIFFMNWVGGKVEIEEKNPKQPGLFDGQEKEGSERPRVETLHAQR